MKGKNALKLIIFLLVALFILNYSFLDKKTRNLLESQDTAIIKRVIDGDTIESENFKIRLLGVNCPEKNEQYYLDAKGFTTSMLLNKTVKLVYGKNKKDRYNRTLAYIFLEGSNLNRKIIENGLANIYFPSGKDRYYNEFLNAWKKCVENQRNLCKKSDDICSECVSLEKLDFIHEEIYLKNLCNFKCNLSGWTIKDEGRNKFAFQEFILGPLKSVVVKTGNKKNTTQILYWDKKKNIWTDSGDSLFLRDKNNKLVLWHSY